MNGVSLYSWRVFSLGVKFFVERPFFSSEKTLWHCLLASIVSMRNPLSKLISPIAEVPFFSMLLRFFWSPLVFRVLFMMCMGVFFHIGVCSAICIYRCMTFAKVRGWIQSLFLPVLFTHYPLPPLFKIPVALVLDLLL